MAFAAGVEEESILAVSGRRNGVDSYEKDEMSRSWDATAGFWKR